ncbi:MAG: extracellular solute-binding protein [Armatimonadota bacterium]
MFVPIRQGDHRAWWPALWFGVLFVFLFLGCGISLAKGKETETKKVTVTLNALWGGQVWGVSPSDPVVKLMKKDPTIEAKVWLPLQIPGGAGRTPLMMSIAGQTAPDLYYCWSHIIRSDIDHGFVYPLNEWIGDDTNGNGQVDLEEAKWPGWAKIPPLVRRIATVDGKIYGLPTVNTYYLGIVYRTDLVRQAGLDPDTPPKTWDEFFYWCQRLTFPQKFIPGARTQKGQRGFYLPDAGFCWLPWVNTVGHKEIDPATGKESYNGYGAFCEQVKTSPTTGKKYVFPMEATSFLAPDTQEDLTNAPTEWRAALDSPEALDATRFYQKLRWQRWIRDPQTQEPVNLTSEQVAAGKVTLPGGRVLSFKKDDVLTGVLRINTGQPGEDAIEWLAKGEVAFCETYVNYLTAFQNTLGKNPKLYGVMPFPAGPGGKPVIQYGRHYAAMSEGVGRRPKEERDKVWQVLQAVTSAEAYDESVRGMVLTGSAALVPPSDLMRLGFKDYIPDVPLSFRSLYASIDDESILTRTEPFVGYWVSMDNAVKGEVLSLILAESGENFNIGKALTNLQKTANTGAWFPRNPDDLKPYRPIAWLIFAVVLAIVAFFVGMIIRTNMVAQVKKTIARAGVYNWWAPWLLLLPALGLIALWGYYPLARGMVMAFQEYHIVGKSPWLGLDNFISIFLDENFYIYVKQTVKFVMMNLLLVFTAPILLSLLLSEIPRGKVFWRSIFFLPQLTSGIVIVLLWKLMYNPTDNGLLNQVRHLFGMEAIDWLGNPQTAMLCTIIPTVWAGMGMASLIYLAALKGIPDELYEAADLDGAGVFSKLRFITIPQLAPLIIINFVGAFIGTFQSMGNIFLLTFGGPGKETMVMGMAIWIEAYANLRFSLATSMAWILGSALIGFTYLQIRILRKVEFRRVEEV